MRIKIYDTRGLSLGYQKVNSIGDTIEFNGKLYPVLHQAPLGDTLTKVVIKVEAARKPVEIKKLNWLQSLLRRGKR